MSGNPVLGIVLLAVVAGIILFRLYMVLGKRTGNERQPGGYRVGGTGQQTAPSSERSGSGNVVLLPDRSQTAIAAPEPAKQTEDAAQGLLDIKLADRQFETDHFVSGARHAYEMIVAAFAAGDRDTLKPLLSDEVYTAFDADIRTREQRQEKIDFTFVGFGDVSITHAELKNGVAEITLSFAAKYISTTTNSSGAVVEGDSKTVREVTDIWSFGRHIDARDPNWHLVATSGAMP